MMILLDTSILTALFNQAHPNHQQVGKRIAELIISDNALLLSPQTLFEFHVVATRPRAVNGLGIPVAIVQQEIKLLRTQFGFRPDPPDLVDRWQGLVSKHSISGKPAHDARQAAWLLAHGLQHIYTLNVRDFARFASAVVCLD